MHPDHDIESRALWWLPLLAGALPLLGTVVAFWLSLRSGSIASCNPFIDGCVSISRAARHDLANILFRALLLPAAALQAACWCMCPAWLRTLGTAPPRSVTALPWLGSVAAVFLVLYGTFLGTDGEGYRWMRRYGVVFYFGFTCIGMLIVAGALQRSTRARRIGFALVALTAALPLLGLVHVLLPLARPAAKDAIENASEWWGGAIFTAFFALLAAAWHATGFAARLSSRPR